MEQAGNVAAALAPPAAGSGERARAAAVVFIPDYQPSSFLKKDNRVQKHVWEKKFEQELERYNIHHEERKRFKELPPECRSNNEFITGTNTEIMQLYDAVAVTRCQVLILKAKGKLKEEKLRQETLCIKEVLFAKPKWKLVSDAGGIPFPFLDHFTRRLTNER